MGNHRADVAPDISSVTPSPHYVGKRRALPADSAAVEQPPTTPYVGKRRATPVEERTDQQPDRALPVVPEAHTSRSRDDHERTDDDLRISTGELRALVTNELEDTAPRPRLRGDDGENDGAVRGAAPSALAVPGPRRSTDSSPFDLAELESVEGTAGSPLVAPSSTTIELPRLSIAATYAADLTGDPTRRLPVAAADHGGRRRSAGRRTRTLLRRLPSMPAIVGACALAAAVAGALATAQPGTTAASSRVTTAGALTGTSEISAVSNGRQVPVSRGGGRDGGPADGDGAQLAAAKRARALTQLDAQAASQDQYIKKNQWGLPILAGDYHLTGRFGDVSGLWATIHTGLDFACPTGTPIHAVASGTITDVGWAGSYGNRTVETLPDGTELWYAHQSQFGVHVGEKVTEGEVIGYVGATGNVTGPHVHLEVRPGGGDPVDPDAALKAHGIDPDANQ